MNRLILLLSLFAMPALADEKDKGPLYKKPMPKSLCKPVAELDARINECKDNAEFLKQMQQCWDKVQGILKDVTADYKARVGAAQLGGQNADFAASKLAQEEAVAAHEFMIKVAQKAYDELDKYYDYVVHPEDATTDQEVLAAGCYGNVVKAMDKISEDMEDRIDEMKESKGMEAEMGAVSGARTPNTGSVNTPAANGKGKGAADAPKQAAPAPKKGSTITGVEQDQKKRSEQKK